VYLTGVYAILGGAGNSSPPFFNIGAIMDDTSADKLSDELIREFSSMGSDYPYIVKLIMDMISILSQQNMQIEAISKHLETITLELNKQHFALDDLMQESDGWISRKGKGDVRPFEYISPMKGTKKEDLN
jgi:hypothetical protein